MTIVSPPSVTPPFWQHFLNDLVKLKDSSKFKGREEIQQLFQSVKKDLSYSDANFKELRTLIGHLIKNQPADKSNAWIERMNRIQDAGQVLWLIDNVKTATRETDLDSQLLNLKAAVALIDQEVVLNDTGANLLVLCAKSRNHVISGLALDCLRRGADPRSTDHLNVTALHYACAYNDTELVVALLSQGAEYSVATKGGSTPLQLLVKYGNSDTVLAFCKQRPEILLEKLDGDVVVYSKALEVCLKESWGSGDLDQFLESHLTKEILRDYGKSLFQLACQHKSTKWVENTIEVAADLSKQEKDFLHEIFDKLAETNQYSKKTLLFLERAWKNGLLPLGPLNEAKSALRMVNDALKLQLQDPALELLTQFEDLYKTLQNDFLSLNAASILDTLNVCRGQLRNQGYAGSDLYDELFKEVEAAHQAERQLTWEWLHKFEANHAVEWLTMTKDICIMPMPLESLLLFCLKENKQHLVWPLMDKYLKEQTAWLSGTKFFYHLVLDKTWMRSPTLAPDDNYDSDGGRISVNVPFFIQEIKRVLQSGSLKGNDSVSKLLGRFVDNSSVANMYLWLWDLWAFSDKRHQIAPEIVERVKDPSQNHVFVPTGFKGHAGLLSIEKGETTARLTMYNTGGGLTQYHAQWKQSDRYQTFSVIEEVPLEDLENIELWQRFIEESSQGKSMDSVYACFEELGARGHKVAPSLHSEDFESKQMNGTCSLQCYLAFFRHQIMNMAEGNKEEKLAAYRLAKAHLITHVIKEPSLPFVGQFGNHAQLKLEKYESFIQLSKIAEDESSYQDHLNLLTDLLNQVGAHTFLKSIKPMQASSMLSRLALLEKCSQKLAKLNHSDVTRSVQLWRNRELTLRNIKSLIRHYLNAGDYKTLGLYLARLYISSRFSKQVQETIIEIANSAAHVTKKQDLLEGLGKLNQYKPGRWHLDQLCEVLIANEQRSLANFIQQQMLLDATEMPVDAI